ncbi:MAG TPA: hypothetical protein VI389_03890, partial [Geobacteraceae bacterium]
GGGGGVMAYAPALFLLYLATVAVVDNPVYYLPLLCYALTVLAFACGEAFAGGAWRLAPRLLAIFPALHLAYGAGLIAGFISPRFRRERMAGGDVSIRVVKKLGESEFTG